MKMTNYDLAMRCVDLAKNFKTLYIKGCIGSPLNDANKKRYTNNNAYNKREDRKELILAADPDTFGFDCVCVIKSILWGWCGDLNKEYGGAVYKSNGVPDIGANELIEVCEDISEDFDEIDVGECLWTTGHVGVYVGSGLAVECTPKWKDGVQITAVNRTITGFNTRNWKKHGRMPYVNYDVSAIVMPNLSRGDKGEEVKTLQRLLLVMGYNLDKYGVDGSFGGVTERAVKAFQQDHDLETDGEVGEETWNTLLKG